MRHGRQETKGLRATIEDRRTIIQLLDCLTLSRNHENPLSYIDSCISLCVYVRVFCCVLYLHLSQLYKD